MIKSLIHIAQVIFLLSILSGPKALCQQFDMVVDATGKGDFTTVQAALNAVPDLRKNETRILIRKGIYKEKLTLATTKSHVTLIGEDLQNTIITYDDFASKLNRFNEEMGTSSSSSFFINGDNFRAENITFQNSAGPVGQAVATRIDGDMVIFIKCRFLGFQDTVYPHGERSRQYFKDCYIEGTTDFIFGWSTVVFEDCEIFSKEGGHYITAASTNEDSPYGFVFYNCKLTGNAPEQSVYLGRPWRPFAKTVFINCEMGEHIKIEGWHNWGKPDAEETSFYAEYQSKGDGAHVAGRVHWSHQLSEKDMDSYTLNKIFDGWIPNQESALNK